MWRVYVCQKEWDDKGIQVRFGYGDLWLTQKAIGELYNCSIDNVSLHLKNIYNDFELDKNLTTEKFLIVQKEGTRAVKNVIAIACDKALTEFEKYRIKQNKLYKSDFDLLLEESNRQQFENVKNKRLI